MQYSVILWLAALPLVLAMFRAITIGDRLYAPVQTGAAGGHHKQLVNATLAGSCIVALLVIPVLGGNAAGGLGQLEDTLALVIMAFGAFVSSAYMAAFRNVTWQKFVGHVLHEAGLFWLVLGICRLALILTDQPATPEGQDAPAQPTLQFLQFAIWGVITLVSMAFILGTASRMRRR